MLKNNKEKKCNRCSKIKYAKAFRVIKSNIGGWKDYEKNHRRSWCNDCEKENFAERYLKNPLPQMKSNAKIRAKKAGVPFNLSSDYIKSIMPKDMICPVFNLKMTSVYGSKKKTNYSPSIDRLIPDKGYVKGNVVIVSSLANQIKSEANLEEIYKVLKFYKKL
ncbi:hypothetical protein OAB44_01940 [Pelagibacteraceae bacterium]|nr:hypothetical protein [Pelagibacteraceae bacterium]